MTHEDPPAVPPPDHDQHENGCPASDRVELIAAGATASAEEQAHLEVCGRCRARIQAASANIAFISEYAASSAQPLTPPTGREPRAADTPLLIDTLEVSPDLVPGYRILDSIHAGGQGVVYRALDQQTQRLVAIKMLLAGRFATPEQVRRFEREAEISASLDHPNVVTIYHMLRVRGGRYAIVMEHIDGVPLDKWRPVVVTDSRHTSAARRRLTSLVRLFVGVCEGVQHAHSRGSLHQDLKPSNILVRGDGLEAVAKVVDFGMARPLRHDATVITQQGHFGGTIRYASPERLRATSDSTVRADVRSDVYSLGVILYELVCGRWPYEHAGSIIAELQAIESAEPMRPSTFNHAIDKDLETIVLTAMHKDPARRYESAGAFGRDLQRWIAGEAVEARRDSGLYQLRKAARRYRVPLAIAGVLFAGLIAVVVQSFRLKDAALQAANARYLSSLNSSRAESTSRDSDVLEAQYMAALRQSPTAEHTLWRIILESFTKGQPADPVSAANRERFRRDALWALRALYSKDPCVACTRLAAPPVAVRLVNGSHPVLLWCGDNGVPRRLDLTTLEDAEVSGPESDQVREDLRSPSARLDAQPLTSPGLRADRGSARVHILGSSDNPARDLLGHTSPIIFAAKFSRSERVSDESEQVISIDQTGCARLWSLAMQPWGGAVAALDHPVAAIWFADDTTMYSVDDRGERRRWSLVRAELSEQTRTTAASPKPGGARIAFNRAKQLFAIDDGPRGVRIADADDRDAWRFPIEGSRLISFAWSPEGDVLATLDDQRRIAMRAPSGVELCSPFIAPPSSTQATPPTNRTPTALGLEHRGERFLIGTSDGFLRIGRADNAWWPEFHLRDEPVLAIDSTDQGEFHAVAFAGAIALMDARCDGRVLFWLSPPNSAPLTAIATSPDGCRIVAANRRGELVVWDLALHDVCIRGNLTPQLAMIAPRPTDQTQFDLPALHRWLNANLHDGDGRSQPAAK